MRPALRVALAQINPTVGDFDANLRLIAGALDLARAKRSDIVVFPELAVTGYPPEDALFQKGFVAGSIQRLRRFAGRVRGIAAVVGFVDQDPQGRLFNAAALVRSGRIEGIYHKIHLPNYGVFDEKRYFTPGQRPFFFDIRGFRAGLSICEDIWDPRSFVQSGEYAGQVSALINLSASPYHAGKHSVRKALVAKLARRLGAPVFYTNLVGGQDELVFDGGSMAADPSGRVAGSALSFREDLWIVDCSRSGRLTPASPRRRRAAASVDEEIYEALVSGTRDYIKKNSFPGVIVGLSGGIDSALVARIAVDAIGSERVHGVTMPSPYTSEATYRDAKRLASSLGIRCDDLRIDGLYDEYLRTLSGVFKGRALDATEENLQARIRGNLLMALSNKFGHLVLTTGNKSEMATGYCTLYGDMAGGFAVLKDVLKTRVFSLSRYRNTKAPKGSIPLSILRRPPSAELKPGQKDQDTLPPYALLDRFLKQFVEEDRSLKEIARAGIPVSIAKKLARMVYRNEYKRRQSPPGIKITPKAFGRDRRMPITSRYEA